MNTHRRDVRPRYGRIAALAASVTVSAVAALAGTGVLATSSAQAGPSARPASYTQHAGGTDAPIDQQPVTPRPSTATTQPPNYVMSSNGTSTSADAGRASALPASSGTGRRIVFSESRQRVWLVGERASGSDRVRRTYLVSGSVTDNLQPGTYAVYSRSRWAVGIEDTGVMQYFVRFTHGPTGAAIGFHSIPTHLDVPLQTQAQLGTPQSHGCIRQNLTDALALWNFAPVDTKVVVVA
jgi:lipoprotein-anchoring transpeptidase ErfK/SrfK